MFLHLSVNLSTEGGGGVFLPQCMLGYTPPGRHSPAQCMLGYTVPSACWDRHGYCCGWYASYWNAFFLPPATKLGQGNIFRSVCQGGHAWQGACVAGGGRAWQILQDMVNERAVRILLECILFVHCVWTSGF